MSRNGFRRQPKQKSEQTVAFGTVFAAIAAGYAPIKVFAKCEALGLEVVDTPGPLRGRMYKRNNLGQRQRVVLTMKKQTVPGASSQEGDSSDARQHAE